MSYTTKSGINIESEEELLARASNLGLTPEEFKVQYISGGDKEKQDADFQTGSQENGAPADPNAAPPKDTESSSGPGFLDILKSSLKATVGLSGALMNPKLQSETESYKVREEKRKSDPLWISANSDVKDQLAQWISNDDHILNVIGDTDINWEHINNKSEGSADFNKKISKAAKSQLSPEVYSVLQEKDVDHIIRDVFKAKANIHSTKRLNAEAAEYESIILDKGLTDEAVEQLQRKKLYDNMSTLRQNVVDANDKLREMKEEGATTAELVKQSREVEKQLQILEDSPEEFSVFFGLGGNTYNQLVSWDGAVIGTELKGDIDSDSSFDISQEEVEDIKAKIANGEIKETTYDDYIGNLFNKNGRDLFYHQEKGKETNNVTINDPTAWRLLKKLGYKAIGKNNNGFEFNVSNNDLGKHYKTIVEGDGGGASYDEDNMFADDYEFFGYNENDSVGRIFSGISAPQGFFGLTDKNEEQEFGFFEQFLRDEDEFGDNDKSRNFKLMLRDFRDEKKQIIAERGILADMHMLNVNVATKKEGPLQKTGDFFARQAELVTEGFGMEGEQWLGTDAVNVNWSNRKEKDVLQSIHDQYGGVVKTEEMKEEIRRSGAYEVAEGVSGFVPALVEFALIDVAAKKVGVITGIPKLAKSAYKVFRGAGASVKTGRSIANITNFTGHALYEEAKMRVAFDEHYHMGGGVGFYSVGRILNGIKFASKSPLLNTAVNIHGKGGLAGMVSVPTAANLEAAIRDLRGNESYMTYIDDTYFDENNEFNLGKHVKGGLVDFFVFSSLGLKGFATKEGRLNYRPIRGKKIGNVTWWKGLETLEVESSKVMTRVENEAELLGSQLENKRKKVFNIDGKKYTRSQAEARMKDLQKEYIKYSDLHASVNSRLNTILEHNDWQDDVKATKKVKKSFEAISYLFPDLKLTASKKVPDWVSAVKDPLSPEVPAARYDKKFGIYINTAKAGPGKLPHEIVHVVMEKAFAQNPALARKMRAVLEDVFDVEKFYINDGSGREARMTLSDFIELNYKGKDLKAHEYVAYAAELLANPRNYSNLVNKGVFTNAETKLKDFATKMGIKDFDISKKDQLIRFLYNFAESVKDGTLNKNQIAKFKNMEKQGLFSEPNKYDARLPETKANMEVDAAFSSMDLKQRSADTQKKFEDLKEENKDIDVVVDKMIKPKAGNKTSVAGEYFDNIIYNTIDRYNAGRIRLGQNEQQILDPTDRYMLATELVYNLNAKEGNKSRGLKQIIKDYENRDLFKDKDGKFAMWDKYGDKKIDELKLEELQEKYGAQVGSKEFKDQAIAEGFKAKQNLTKTVMQTLQLRIYELKGGSLDKGKTDQELFQTVSYDASPELKAAVENQSGTGYTDFRLPSEKKTKETITLDGKKYNYPIRVSEVYDLNTEKYSPKVPDVIENLSIEKLTYENIAKSMQKELSIDIQESIGLNPSMKPKEYVSVAEKWLETNEQIAFEGLERTSNPDMYEPTNINKSIFKSLFTKTNTKFKTSELPDFLAKETNARTFKWKKNSYKKGELKSILMKGRDAGVVKKNFLEYFNRNAKVASSQVVRDKISSPNVQDLIKSKNLNKFHNLKADQVLPYVKEAIRGATPDAFNSMEMKTWDKFIGSWKKFNHAKSSGVIDAYKSISSNMTEKEQAVIDAYKNIFFSENGYNVGQNAIKELQASAQALRNLEQIKVGVVNPKVWNRFKGINSEIITMLSKENISKSDLERLTINQTIPSRVKNNKKYFEFVNDLMDTMDPSLKPLMQKSYGDGSYKFNGKDYKTVADKFTSTGKSENLPFNIDHVKTVNNATFKKKYMEELAKTKGLKDNPTARQAFFKRIVETYLVPKITKKRIKELGKELKEGKISKKAYDEAIKPVTIDQVIKANEGLQKYMYGKIFDFYSKSKDKINAINQIQFFLQLQTSIDTGFSRALATHTALTLDKGKMYSEHQFQVMNFNGNFLMNMLKNSGSKAEFLKNFDPLAKQFKQSIIPKELQLLIDSPEHGGNTGSVYLKGYNSDLPSEANYLYMYKLGNIVDVRTGKTYKEIIEAQVNASQTLNEINKIKENLLKDTPTNTFDSKDMTAPEIAEKLMMIDKAFGLARKRNKKRKGISVFDFDDTLARTNSKIGVTMPDGSKKKIDATEFALKSAELESQGAKFDFSEFNKVVDGKKGPLADLALKRQGKFGNEDIFILTARPQESAPAIKAFMKELGLEIPLENITGLADGRPSAKALWVLDKASKGYNDFYFADDAYKNVKAVQDVLNVIDVKSKVQQAFNSMDLNADINGMIERVTGIGKDKKYSEFKAKLVGGKSGKTKIIASSAQDFEGLMYRLLGKGEQGNKDKKWLQDNLQKPFNRANNAISSDRISTLNDFKKIKSNLQKAGIPKNLRKTISGEPFSIEQSVRVYTWTKQGMEIPGLSKADLKTMVDYVESKPALMKFSNELIDLGKGDGYQKPGQSWEAGTITTDLLKSLNEGRRSKYLEQSGWTDAVDIIFSKENLNKMEAGLGTKWREAMENSLRRMKTGRNRSTSSQESKLENMALDWLNNSVGSIMFLNTKSAVLQTISAVNYINWSDNNPLKAGAAIANFKNYGKHFAEIFNSDFMIERRGGLKINVNENEIAEAAKQNGPKGVIAMILKKGFVLTQFADSFAIAAGGSSFYINRTKTYEKQGMSSVEAKKKAFEDFRELTEQSQQSSRADRISMQQASALGRVVLAFANTPSQYARLMQKAASDIKNGRGDFKTNMSKILYYGFVQNLIFNALQTALFRDAFDEEEGIQSDTSFMANGMISSLLRGMGWQGAAIDTAKNIVMDVVAQSKKDRPKYGDSALKLLDISPPLDSKISKLRSAGKAFEYDMKEIKSSGWSLDNPAYLAGGKILSATANIPLDRLFIKYNNIDAALAEDTEDWQSVALALGWSEWQLGMNEKGQTAEEFVREIFKRETFKRETFKRD